MSLICFPISQAVGMVPPDQDGPVWWELRGDDVHYVEPLKLHFQLFNPLEQQKQQ